MIPLKSKTTDADWQHGLERVAAEYPRERAVEQVEIVVDRIFRLPGKLALAWSGGKDSQVLRLCCNLAEVEDGVLCISGLEFPAMDRWRFDRLDNLEVVKSKHDAAWLQDHQKFLFTKDANTFAQFQKMVVHHGQERYYREHDLDGMILGRRWADDNYTGRGRGEMSYTTKQNVTRHSPMADMSHEDLLGIIHWYGLELAPCYGWRDGWTWGTGPWVYGVKMRGEFPDRAAELDYNFRGVHEIDSTIIPDAAIVLEPAREWMERNDITS